MVDESAAGVRLDVWLSEASGKVRTEVQRLIGAGRVSVNGSPAVKSMRVVPGQSVELSELPVELPGGKLPPVEVRYEDCHLAIVDKPAGLVVHPAPGTRMPTLVDVLATRMPLAQGSAPNRPGIVHRLDKGTSGLLIVAKTDVAYALLAAAMRDRRIEKSYLALVHGRLALGRGRIEAPVGRSTKRPTAMAVSSEGRPSVTEFEVIEAAEEATYLKVFLLTGRTHQIRVHLAHIKHPVVGDRRYGTGAEQLSLKLGLDRPFLHAHELRFAHPITAELLHFEQPLPEDLAGALAKFQGA
ncbi:MAG: RluA family pseudouridine synthase [Actinomycetota bacterium]